VLAVVGGKEVRIAKGLVVSPQGGIDYQKSEDKIYYEVVDPETGDVSQQVAPLKDVERIIDNIAVGEAAEILVSPIHASEKYRLQNNDNIEARNLKLNERLYYDPYANGVATRVRIKSFSDANGEVEIEDEETGILYSVAPELLKRSDEINPIEVGAEVDYINEKGEKKKGVVTQILDTGEGLIINDELVPAQSVIPAAKEETPKEIKEEAPKEIKPVETGAYEEETPPDNKTADTALSDKPEEGDAALSADNVSVDNGAAENTNDQEKDGPIEEAKEINTPLSEQQAAQLVELMEQNAVEAPVLELTPENWYAEFGEEGIVETPVGKVKMGENQYLKIQAKGRQAEFGMVKPTLTSPDVVIEKKAEKENVERDTKLLFVKTFTDNNGKKYTFFESVTVKQDGLEVSISSHIADKKAIAKELINGTIAYNRFANGSEWYLPENQNGLPDLVPAQTNVSEGKGNETDSDDKNKSQENESEINPQERIKEIESQLLEIRWKYFQDARGSEAIERARADMEADTQYKRLRMEESEIWENLMRMEAERDRAFIEGELPARLPKRSEMRLISDESPIFTQDGGIVNIRPIPQKTKKTDTKTALFGITDKDHQRPALTGIFHDAENGVDVATDGTILVAIPAKNEKSWIEGRDAMEIKGKYPAWRSVIPDNPVKVKTGNIQPILDKLAGAVRASKFFINRMLVQTEANGVTFLFHPEYLFKTVNAMRSTGSSSLVFEFSDDQTQALIIRDSENANKLSLVMPSPPITENTEGTLITSLELNGEKTSDEISPSAPLLEKEYIQSGVDKYISENSLTEEEFEDSESYEEVYNKIADSYAEYIRSLAESGELQRMYDSANVGDEIKIRKAIEASGLAQLGQNHPKNKGKRDN
jgi:hypothetical protein